MVPLELLLERVQQLQGARLLEGQARLLKGLLLEGLLLEELQQLQEARLLEGQAMRGL